MTDLLDQGVPTAPPPAAPRRPSPAGLLRTGWRQLTSMRTALLLLFLLALAAVPGSLLPQRGLNPSKVALFYRAHPALAPRLDRLSLFDVFAAPWFAAVYLLLFVSLAGCLLPRVRVHARVLRSRPPAAPAYLGRLPESARWNSNASPAQVVEAARRRLRARHFRADVHPEPGGALSLAAEKGYLHETGSLVFHLALLLLLAGVAAGGLFGYKGTVLVTEGDGFSNTVSQYDELHPGRLFRPAALVPFGFVLDSFTAGYQPNGQPRSFDAQVTYTARPDGPARHYDIRVNHPLDVGGARTYLIGHGYAPRFTVRDGVGRVVFDGPVPFLPRDGSYTSDGVVKVPDARPRQLAFAGTLTPTTVSTALGPASVFPALRRPQVTLLAYRGDLGLDAGAPQSVYALDTRRLTRLGSRALRPGQSWALPGGGSLAYSGTDEWATFQVTSDPGRTAALVAAVLVVAGLLVSLRVRRRRVWVRAAPAAGPGAGRTVVEAGGLARTDADGFAEEFAALVARLAPPAVGGEEEACRSTPASRT